MVWFIFISWKTSMLLSPSLRGLSAFSTWSLIALCDKTCESAERTSLNKTSTAPLLTSNSRATPRSHLSLSFLWQRQETLWCQLCRGSPSNVKFVCLRLSWWSLSQSVHYSVLHCRLLTLSPALFIDPKATCVYLVYYYTLTSSRHMLSGRLRSVFSVSVSCFPCQLLITLELPDQASTNLERFGSCGW